MACATLISEGKQVFFAVFYIKPVLISQHREQTCPKSLINHSGYFLFQQLIPTLQLMISVLLFHLFNIYSLFLSSIGNITQFHRNLKSYHYNRSSLAHPNLCGLPSLRLTRHFVLIRPRAWIYVFS